MQLNVQPATELPAGPNEILLRRRKDSWSFTEKGLLRRSGVKVRDILGHQDLIAVSGAPRAGKTFSEVLGHANFSNEGKCLQAEPALPS